MLGFLLIDKPLGISSHDVIYRLRKRLGIKKIGHAGTLDPLATGLLVVGVGPATRFLSYLDLDPKTYEFTVLFGRSTDSFDSEGSVVSEHPVPENLADLINQNLAHLVGTIEQLPPMYSAVKVEGKPLYSYARKGVEIKRERREITIHSLTLVQIADHIAQLKVTCSTGTYVRTIAHDLGEMIGCGAHAVSIRRTYAGRFSVEKAKTVDEVGVNDLISVSEGLAHMPCLTLNNADALRVRDGRSIPMLGDDGTVLVMYPNGSPLGIAILQENVLSPKSLVPREESIAQI